MIIIGDYDYNYDKIMIIILPDINIDFIDFLKLKDIHIM